jgi:RimJ/RimL family protein N-acetyltransferase
MSVELTTRRLVLRRWREGDVEPFAAINADPEVMRFIGTGATRTVEETRERMAAAERRWDEDGFGLFAVELRATGELIGFAGLMVPTFLPEILPAVELGWRLRRDLWGRGLATEAAREALRFAFDDVGLDRVVSCINIANTASIRVAEKLGMTLERTTIVPDLDVPCHVYERHRYQT